METLPNELVVLILEYCDIRSVLKFIRTSKRMRKLKPLLKDRRVLSEPVYCLREIIFGCIYSFNGASKRKYFDSYMIYDRILVKGDKLVMRGKRVHYHDSGKIIEIMTDDGKGNGRRLEYSEDGWLRMDMQHVNGIKHGKYLVLRPSGRIHIEYNVKDNCKHGFAYRYDEDGVLIEFARFYSNQQFAMRGRRNGPNEEFVKGHFTL